MMEEMMELQQEVESKGSAAGSQAPTVDEGKEEATEGATPAGTAAAEKGRGPSPTGEDNYVKGQGRPRTRARKLVCSLRFPRKTLPMEVV